MASSKFLPRINALQGRFPCTVEERERKRKKKEIRGKEVEKRRNHGIFREKTKRDVVADVVNFLSFRAG